MPRENIPPMEEFQKLTSSESSNASLVEQNIELNSSTSNLSANIQDYQPINLATINVPREPFLDELLVRKAIMHLKK